MGPIPEQTIAALAILGICGALAYGFIFWVREAPRTVDPWGGEVEATINNDEAVAVCHRCFTPQTHNGWFCPECGGIVGSYCNYMPYLYLFSQGEVFRAGVTERLRRGPLIVVGYIVVSFTYLSLLAPVYWFLFYRNLNRTESTLPAATEGQLADEMMPPPEGTVNDVSNTVNRCAWCGKEYPAEVTTCPIDGNPLVRQKGT